MGHVNHSSVKLCECGCGRRTALAKWTDKRCNIIRGQARRFIQGHVRRGRKFPSGKPLLAYACPHTDRPNLHSGFCTYCYFSKRRGYSTVRRRNLYQKQAERIAIGIVGLSLDRTAHMRWMRYRMAPAEYKERLRKQGNCCAACGCAFGKTKHRAPHIDHDHACCPKVPTCGECTRGITCMRCNIVLGLLEREPHLLPAFLRRYLRQYRSK